LINTNGNTMKYFHQEFIDRYISSLYIEEITVGKKIIKKNDDVSFLPTEFIPSVKSLVNCEHCSSCQLRRELPIENFIGIFQRALKLFTFQLYC